ncbi:MAG TPA: hypothetical protein VFQ44_27355 [Streptosporangiaceae bacterium]|nr:hypothetical protein [Streptosporangiaceae bacterium]
MTREVSAVPGKDVHGRVPDEAVEVLRSVWTARGQSEDDLNGIVGNEKSCKRMTDVGFDGLAEDGNDMRAAWRETLEREGKLSEGSGSVSDLVFGRADRHSG